MSKPFNPPADKIKKLRNNLDQITVDIGLLMEQADELLGECPTSNAFAVAMVLSARQELSRAMGSIVMSDSLLETFDSEEESIPDKGESSYEKN